MLLWTAFLLACPSVDEDTDPPASTDADTDTDTDTDTSEDACGPSAESDCAPEDPEVGPLHPERIGDGIDQDCDGSDTSFRWWDAPALSEEGLAGPRLAALDGDVYLGTAWAPGGGGQPVFGRSAVRADCPGVWTAPAEGPVADEKEAWGGGGVDAVDFRGRVLVGQATLGPDHTGYGFVAYQGAFWETSTTRYLYGAQIPASVHFSPLGSGEVFFVAIDGTGHLGVNAVYEEDGEIEHEGEERDDVPGVVAAALPDGSAVITSDPATGTRTRVGLILGGWQVVQLDDPVIEEGPVAWDLDSLVVDGRGVWAEARGPAGAVVAVDGVEGVAVDADVRRVRLAARPDGELVLLVTTADTRVWLAATRAGAWEPAEEVVPPLGCVDDLDVRVAGDGLTVLAVRCGLDLSWAAYHPG